MVKATSHSIIGATQEHGEYSIQKQFHPWPLLFCKAHVKVVLTSYWGV